MLLNSFYYFIFLGIVFILYYTVSNKLKWLILLLASLFFIGTIAPNLIIFTLLFTVINYFLGLALFNIKNKPLRIKVFWLGIFVDVGILAFYKYINFLIENVNFLIGLFPENPSIPYISLIIPVGISYYTFQALGYLIRINRGAEKPEKDFIKFAVFLTFFPKFLSGPVERSNHFFPQLNSKIEFKSENVTIGLRLFLWGLFKKVVIGNNLAAPVFGVYDDLHSFSGIPLITVWLIQAIHIYADFSGYTDMALGSAKILGINLIDNFNRPFLAKSVGDFWRRWHISLSAWCNDFIFSPFIVKYRKMGNKAALWGIFITFFVIGIWHGANWTFVMLGVLQAIAIVYEFYTKRKRIQIASKLNPKFVVATSRIITYLFFSFSLIFFNAHSIQDAWHFITHLFSGIEFKLIGHDFIYKKGDFILAMASFAIIFVLEILQEKGIDTRKIFFDKPKWVRWIGYYLMIVLIYFYSGGQETFVYLQF